MARDALDKVRRLRQSDVTWLCSVRRAHSWVAPDDGSSPYRPYTTLVVDQGREVIRLVRIRGREKPPSAQVLEILHRAMRKPMWGSGKPMRPTLVFLDDAGLARELAPRLAEVGVKCVYRASLPLADALFPNVTSGRLKYEPVPGLSSIHGATEPLLREFFTVAAEYYRQAPWQWIQNWEPIEICYPPQSPPRYALVLGSGGEFFGLSLYESKDDLRVVFSNLEPERTGEQIPWVSVVFEDATTMAFDDLDALEKYGWPVAGEKAYPAAFKTVPPGSWGLPSASDLAWLAAAMRVMPDFVTDRLHADRGLPRPAEAVYALGGVHGGQSIALRYPVSLLDPQAQELEEYIETKTTAGPSATWSASTATTTRSRRRFSQANPRSSMNSSARSWTLSMPSLRTRPRGANSRSTSARQGTGSSRQQGECSHVCPWLE
jgi:hypothetical protein